MPGNCLTFRIPNFLVFMKTKLWIFLCIRTIDWAETFRDCFLYSSGLIVCLYVHLQAYTMFKCKKIFCVEFLVQGACYCKVRLGCLSFIVSVRCMLWWGLVQVKVEWYAPSSKLSTSLPIRLYLHPIIDKWYINDCDFYKVHNCSSVAVAEWYGKTMLQAAVFTDSVAALQFGTWRTWKIWRICRSSLRGGEGRKQKSFEGNQSLVSLQILHAQF